MVRLTLPAPHAPPAPLSLSLSSVVSRSHVHGRSDETRVSNAMQQNALRGENMHSEITRPDVS